MDVITNLSYGSSWILFAKEDLWLFMVSSFCPWKQSKANEIWSLPYLALQCEGAPFTYMDLGWF